MPTYEATFRFDADDEGDAREITDRLRTCSALAPWQAPLGIEVVLLKDADAEIEAMWLEHQRDCLAEIAV